MTTPHILIVIGSTREQRRGEPIARWFAGLAEAREDLTPELVDLAELGLPFLTQAMPPGMDPDARDEAARDWSAKVAAADGYVLVVPEYNHGYSAALKNALDLLFAEWNRKPVGFVSYGGASGGTRAVEQLRQVAVELELAPVRGQVVIPRVWAALDETGTPREAELAGQAGQLLDDMAWWAQTLRAGRMAAATAA